MAQTQIAPRIRGFICTTTHPDGCAANIARQADVARAAARAASLQGRSASNPPLRVLVIGASTGYGMAARIAATFAHGAQTIGVFYERPGEGTKAASPGWYNTAAFDGLAKAEGKTARHVNGDAFGDAAKAKTVALIRDHFAGGQADIVIYSLASPRRTDPKTGVVYGSVLKPIGHPYVGKTVDLNHETVTEVTVQSATDEEIEGSERVMGGDDLELWANALLSANVLAPGAMLLPLSYIGPSVTFPIYRSGTIGRAKEHIEATTRRMDALLQQKIGGRAIVSINKAVVTQASAAIPTVPLYYSVLTQILKLRNQHEEPIHQMVRLFAILSGKDVDAPLVLDGQQRIRLDDWEMDADVQAEVTRRWPLLTTETFRTLGDWDDYKFGFRQLFGFDVEGVDYETPVEVERTFTVEPI